MTGLRWPVRLVLLALALVAVLALGARGVVTPPDLVVLVVVGVALAAGSGAGALTGLVGGWLVDLAPPVGVPLGLSARSRATTRAVTDSRSGSRRPTWSATPARSSGSSPSTTTGALPSGWGFLGSDAPDPSPRLMSMRTMSRSAGSPNSWTSVRIAVERLCGAW